MAPRKTKARVVNAKKEMNGNETHISEDVKENNAETSVPSEEVVVTEKVVAKANSRTLAKKKKTGKMVEEKVENNNVEEIAQEKAEDNNVEETKSRTAAKKKKAGKPVEETVEDNNIEESTPAEENNDENDMEETKSRSNSRKKKTQQTTSRAAAKKAKVEEPVVAEVDSEENDAQEPVEEKVEDNIEESTPAEESNEENDMEETKSRSNSRKKKNQQTSRAAAKKAKVEEPVVAEEDREENDTQEPVEEKVEGKNVEESTPAEENNEENDMEETKSRSNSRKKKTKQTTSRAAAKKAKVEEPVVAEDDSEENDMQENEPSVENESDNEETSKKTSGRGKTRKREQKTSKSNTDSNESPSKKAKTTSAKGSRSKIPDVTQLKFDNNSKSPSGKKWNVKISSWNVNGIRAWLEKNGQSFITHEDPDVFCVQETKCSEDKIPAEIKEVNGYYCYWLSGDKEGYSGVGLMSKKKPKNVEYGIGKEEHDNEGRVITAEFDKFYVVNTYVPNAGRGLTRLEYRMEWDKDFRKYLKKLDEKKRVILCGDLNVAHNEIDLANPKSNKKTAGFTKEERDGFSKLLDEGFVDSFRHLYPDETGAYTYWTYMMNARAKNVGWRLDYFTISKELSSNLCDSVIRKDVFGSDHCPITLFLESE